MIRATLAYLFLGTFVLIFAPVALIWMRVSKDTRLAYQLGRFCVRLAGWICQIKVEIRGREKLSPGQTYVFLSNHQGNVDAPALFHAIPRDVRALIKKEIMSIPVLSLLLKELQFVPLDRSHPRQSRAGIDRGVELLRQGYSFFAFPEGTRSRNGSLGEFKKGVFIMALKAGKPIVPVSVADSRKIQAPGMYAIRPGSVTLTFHEPIPTEGMTLEDRDRLVATTRVAIASGLTRA